MSGQNRLRSSQLVGTFGPGALVDLPRHAVLMAGLDHWPDAGPEVLESRLLATLRNQLKTPNLVLRVPLASDADPRKPVAGAKAFLFPEWFVADVAQPDGHGGRSRPLVHRQALDAQGRFRPPRHWIGNRDAKSRAVVPVRFVQGCPSGHLSDIPWSELVHGWGMTQCPNGGTLWFDEGGTTGDISEVFVRCDACDAPRVPVQQLARTSDQPRLGACKGKRPWLGPNTDEKCSGLNGKPHANRLLVRHATNAYFGLTLRAISIPDLDDALRKAVDAVWEDFLSVAEKRDDVTRERRKKRVSEALQGFDDDAVWGECKRRSNNTGPTVRAIRDVELDTLLAAPTLLGDDRPDVDFLAQRLPPLPASGPSAKIERVVLVHRLREVVAQYGFTRFEAPPRPPGDREVDLPIVRAALADELKWLPAYENRGEGFFLTLDPQSVKDWLKRPAVQDRAKQLLEGVQSDRFPDVKAAEFLSIWMPYILLHSLSHLLLSAVSLDCGYASASIRERIYVRDGAYGLLLYTGTPDAEGTLGGLLEVGRNLARPLTLALESGRLCSNDPICSDHDPANRREARPLHGAACHGCLLVAESSCERRNDFLDRALVVPTVSMPGAAFFREVG